MPSPIFFYFHCSIKKIEDGNLCEICLQNFEITAIFALQYAHKELPTSAGKYSHTIAQTFLVYIEYIAKNKKRPTGTRKFCLRLMIPERAQFTNRHSMP